MQGFSRFKRALTSALVITLVGFLGYASIGLAALTFNATTITSDGALTLTGAATSTWDIGTGLLSVQTTNNGAVTFGTGVVTLTSLGFTNATGTNLSVVNATTSKVNFVNATGTTLSVTNTSSSQINFVNATGTTATVTTVVGTNVSSTGTFAVSATGTAMKAIYSGTASLTFTSVPGNVCNDQTITVSGASTGDSVSIGAVSTLSSSTSFNGFVSGADTVSVRLCNISSSTITVGAATWRATVFKF